MPEPLALLLPVSLVAAWPLGLLALLAIVGVFLLVLLRRGLVPGPRAPRPRHMVVRIVCGVLGVGILAAVAAGTWSVVRKSYGGEAPGAEITIRVPTQPPPALPVPAESFQRVELKKARLLFEFIVTDFSGGEPEPIHLEQQEIRWPDDKMRVFEKEFQTSGYTVRYHFVLPTLYVRKDSQNDPPELRCDGTYSIGWSARGTSSGTIGGLIPEGIVYACRMREPYGLEKPPLSIVAAPMRELTVIALFTRVAEDDPLKAIPAAELLRARQTEIGEALGRWSDHGGPQRFRSRVDDIPFRGAALAIHIGASSLLLLAAAMLLSQLFARRGLAFVGVLAAVVLYVAALDRAVLGAYLGRMDDPEAPLATRVVACEQATDTFFYRRTALAAMEKLASDLQAPAPLRSAAGEAVRELRLPSRRFSSPAGG